MAKNKIIIISVILIVAPPLALFSFGDVGMGDVIWAAAAMLYGLILLRSTWQRTRTKDNSSLQKDKLVYMKKTVYVSAIIGGIIAEVRLLQVDLSIAEKLFATVASLTLIASIAIIFLKIITRKLDGPHEKDKM